MKSIFSLLLFCGIVIHLSAQNSIAKINMKSGASFHDGYRSGNPAPVEKTHLYMKQQLQSRQGQAGGSRAVTVVPVGTAGNLFTILSPEVNRIAASQTLNTVTFIHRSDPTIFPASNLGQYRYDVSYDGGGTWELNYGVLNPKGNQQTLAGRYPNVNIYNPLNNTNPDNAYLAYLGTWLPFDAGGDWDGHFTGVARLNNDTLTFTETVSYPNNQDIDIARGMCNGSQGVFWAVNWANASSTALDPSAILLFKGVWNSTAKDVDWTLYSTLDPDFDKTIAGTAQATALNMSFDPTGQYGWIGFLGDITPAGDTTFSVNFYKTTNGGSTWTGPIAVSLSSFSNVVNNLTAGGVPTTAFDMDMVTDANGSPHALVVVGSSGTGQAYSITTGATAGLKIYDITYVPTAAANCRWQAIYLDDIFTFRGDIVGTISEDNRPQCSLSPDGEKVFFGWLESDVNITGGTNELPNLKTKALNVMTGLATPVVNWTETDLIWSGGALFSSFSPDALGVAGTYTVPTVFTQLTGLDTDPVKFFYVQNIQYTDADFTGDIWAPVITLNGTSPTTIVVSNPFNDPGATAIDNLDGNISGTLVINNNVNTNQVGTYYVTYNITDAAGNVACEVTRVVNVVSSPDNTPPVISLTGASTINVDVCDFFSDAGATASDNLDGNISGNIAVTGNVPDPLSPGTYTINYNVTDGAGNPATTVTRTVIVSNLPPTITLNGANPIDIELCQTYTEPFAIAVDNCLGSLTVGISNNINPDVVGNYTVTYTADDGVNPPVSVTRTVNITPDITPPSIGLTGANPQNIYLGDSYTELGATANDCADGNISGAVVSNGSTVVNTGSRGDYAVSYNVSDAAGNAATAVTRTVKVNTEPDPDFTFILSGGTVFFTDASLYTPTSWQWDFGDQLANTNRNPAHTYAQNGDYNVCLRSANAFNAAPFNKPIKQSCKTVSITQVGIEETAIGKYFDLYPNPSGGMVTVEIKNASFEKVSVNVFDAAGKEIRSLELGGQNAGSKFGLNLSGNPDGVYLIKIQTEQGVATKSVIIDK